MEGRPEMTTTPVPGNSVDSRAAATASVAREASATVDIYSGTAVAIGGGIALTAGHVLFAESAPETPKTGLGYRFTFGDGLAGETTARIDASGFADSIVNLGWGLGGDDVALLRTMDAGVPAQPLLIYADPRDAEGTLTSFGFPSTAGFDGQSMVQTTGSQSTGGYGPVGLGGGVFQNVLITQPGSSALGGQSGSGVWLSNDADRDGRSETYLVGVLTLDVTYSSGQSAIGYEPIGDIYTDLVSFIEANDLSADLFARATLVSGQLLGSPNTTVEGSLLHEDLIGSVNADTLSGGDGDDRLYGFEGSDTLTDGAGRDNLIGGAGGDVFALSADGQADAIKDFEVGIDRIDVSAWGVSDFSDLQIYTHASGKSILRYASEAASINDGAWTLSADLLTADSFIFAGAGALVPITGTDGNDKLFGTGAAEAISDGGGVDNLFGRGGADVFVMAADGRADSIKDFENGRDQIDLSAWGVAEFAQLTLSDHASGKVILRYGAEILSIDDGARTLTAAGLTADDFIFA